MLSYFKIKNCNLTIILAVVWLKTVYRDTFFPSKAKIKPCCHAIVIQLRMLASLTDSKGQEKNQTRIKKQIVTWGVKVGWSLLNHGRDLHSRWARPLGWMGQRNWSGSVWLEVGIQPEGWLELAKRWKMPTWPCPQQAGLELALFLESISDSIPSTLFWGPNIWHCYSGCSCHLSRCEELSSSSTHGYVPFYMVP